MVAQGESLSNLILNTVYMYIQVEYVFLIRKKAGRSNDIKDWLVRENNERELTYGILNQRINHYNMGYITYFILT